MTTEECQKQLEAWAEAYDHKCRELVAALEANQRMEKQLEARHVNG